MFTGIVEEVGQVVSIKKGAKSSRVTISGDMIFDDIKLGDSVSTNGVCLTVSDLGQKTFDADIMHETLKFSTLGTLNVGHRVNLERAMPMNGRFGGHIVSGHIDGVGTVRDITKVDNAFIYTIETDPSLTRYMVHKGSITIDGISLTLTDVADTWLSVSIIPHTKEVTTLGDRVVGTKVNLEVDMLAKYVEKLLGLDGSTKKEEKKLNMDFLRQHGF